MKRLLALAVLLPVFVLSGCYDAKDIGYSVAIIAMGIDRAESGDYRVSFHIENRGNAGDEEGESSAGTDKDVIVVEGSTIDGAYQRANELTGVDMSLENLKMVVLSEAICQEGILEPVETLLIGSRIKNNAFIVAARGEAETILQLVEPEDEEYLSIYYEEILFNRYRSNTRFFFLEEVYFNLIGDPGQDILLPTVSIAGNDSFSSPVEFMGGAVFSKGRLSGYLGEEDMMMARLLTGSFHSKNIQVEYPEGSGRYVTVSLKQKRKPSIRAKIVDGQIEETIRVRLVGQYQTMRQKEDFQTFERNLTNQLRTDFEKRGEALMQKTIGTYHADICGVGKHLRLNFADIASFKAFDYESKLPEGRYKVDVEFSLRCVGRFTFDDTVD